MMCSVNICKMRLKSKTIVNKTTPSTLSLPSIKDPNQSSKPSKSSKINTTSDSINQQTCSSTRRVNYKSNYLKTCVVKSMKKNLSSPMRDSSNVSRILCLSKMPSKPNKKFSRINWKPTARTSNGIGRNLISSGDWGVNCKLMAICLRLRSISTNKTCKPTKAMNWRITLTCLACKKRVSQWGKRVQIVLPRLRLIMTR